MRKKVALALDGYVHNSPVSGFLNYALTLLILLNVLAVLLGTVHSIKLDYGDWLYKFEIFSVVVFTVEYILRVWSCVDLDEYQGNKPWKQRMSYMLSPMSIIDLVAILPFYLQYFFAIDLRFLRVLRILRVFKLTRYFGAVQLLYKVLRDERHALFAAFSILFITLIVSSSGIYLIEREIQPDKFGSIPAAMWWAMATLTTVGYGDVTPVTPGGKLFGGIITIAGMGMVALPTGIIVSGFSEQLRLRRQKFTALVKQVLEDDVVTGSELKELELLRRSLDLSKEEADLLMKLNGLRKSNEGNRCPHCNKLINEKALSK